jgi:hypothetical protein
MTIKSKLGITFYQDYQTFQNQSDEVKANADKVWQAMKLFETLQGRVLELEAQNHELRQALELAEVEKIAARLQK